MPNTINMLLDVNIPIAVQLGQTRMSVRDLLKMKKGQVVKLNRMAGAGRRIHQQKDAGQR